MKRILLFFAFSAVLPLLSQQSSPYAQMSRTLANLRADLTILTEEQKVLLAKIAELEQENNRKGQLLQEQQRLLSAMNQRLSSLEKELQTTQDGVKRQLEKNRESMRTELEKLGKTVSRELSEMQSAPGNGKKYSKIVELTIQAGDTLSAIAKQAGVGVEEIRALNNLNSDQIRIGQKLKVPVKE